VVVGRPEGNRNLHKICTAAHLVTKHSWFIDDIYCDKKYLQTHVSDDTRMTLLPSTVVLTT
jgi:hypothetical protein